jgi:amino-acid N-acetyltransferase
MKDWISWFRHASPYINQHRNKTMVFALSGEAIEHDNVVNIVHDLALLSSLGIRIVLVLGARPQIDKGLAVKEISTQLHKNMRVTSKEMVPTVLEAYGRVRSEMEALFSTGLINSPMHGAHIRVVSGNFVSAKPIGILDGIDFGWTGKARRIDAASILAHTNNGELVIQPSLGYAVTGEIFNLSYDSLATDVAIALGADKLIFMGNDKPLADEKGEICRQITAADAEQLSDVAEMPFEISQQLKFASNACQKGVDRVHFLSYVHDGALLEELFTRDGVGAMVSIASYDVIRSAAIDDLNGILELIAPLEEQGILVKRSRELLETELDAFTVNVRDNAIIACAALYPYPDSACGELSCFAVDPAYRREGRGDHILATVVAKAKSLGLKHLFVLTTQTEHWFLERGFELASTSDLPGAKRYNADRNAKVLRKPLL